MLLNVSDANVPKEGREIDNRSADGGGKSGTSGLVPLVGGINIQEKQILSAKIESKPNTEQRQTTKDTTKHGRGEQSDEYPAGKQTPCVEVSPRVCVRWVAGETEE